MVPDELKAKVHEYVNGYVPYEHVLSEGANPRRREGPDLTDYARKRFALAGNPAAWIARIEEIARAGAIKLWLNAEGGNFERQLHYLRLLGEQIMSRFV